MSRPKGQGFEYSYRDLLTSLLIVFMALSALALVTVAKKEEKPGVAQGDLAVTLQWDKGKDADVDLWVRAPHDQAVGYSHPGDRDCNLARDDLGKAKDSESRNEEFIMCRASDRGEWIVNVVMFDEYDAKFPTQATVAVRKIGQTREDLFTRTVSLEHDGQETTVARFQLDEHGELIPGSVNQAPATLFGAGTAP